MNRPLVIALAIATTATAAPGSITVIGGGLAEDCYQAAESRFAGRDGLATCSRALTEEPLSPEDRVATYVNRGILHMRLEAVARADADFDRALELDPAEPDAWLNKAILTVRHRRSVDALPMVDKAIDLKSRRPALAYYIRAIVNEDRGDLRAAYRDFRRARDLEPAWPQPAIELARFKVR